MEFSKSTISRLQFIDRRERCKFNTWRAFAVARVKAGLRGFGTRYPGEGPTIGALTAI